MRRFIHCNNLDKVTLKDKIIHCNILDIALWEEILIHWNYLDKAPWKDVLKLCINLDILYSPFGRYIDALKQSHKALKKRKIN